MQTALHNMRAGLTRHGFGFSNIRGSDLGGRRRRVEFSVVLSVVCVRADVGGSEELDPVAVGGGDEDGATADSGSVIAATCIFSITTAAAAGTCVERRFVGD